MNDYGEMFYGTLPPDTQDFRQVLAGIGRMLKERAAAAGQRIVESGQEARALQNQAFGDPTNPLRITDENALARLTDMMMGGPLGFAPAGITAYHGSPYLFRQFDPAKIGAGEGAQAYGVGAGYTAEARPVAETYIKNRPEVVAKFNQVSPETVEGMATRLRYFYGNDVEAIAKDIKNRPQFKNVSVEQLEKDIKKSEERFKSVMQSGGYVYKGDIPDEILPKFLDWDKPLTKDAPQEVKDAFNKIIKDYPEVKDAFMKGFKENQPGWYYYSVLGDLAKTGDLAKNQQFASDVLENAGIRGIRYLDQGSRGEGKGTSNFIPFRTEDYKIQEINDIPIEDYIRRGLLAP